MCSPLVHALELSSPAASASLLSPPPALLVLSYSWVLGPIASAILAMVCVLFRVLLLLLSVDSVGPARALALGWPTSRAAAALLHGRNDPRRRCHRASSCVVSRFSIHCLSSSVLLPLRHTTRSRASHLVCAIRRRRRAHFGVCCALHCSRRLYPSSLCFPRRLAMGSLPCLPHLPVVRPFPGVPGPASRPLLAPVLPVAFLVSTSPRAPLLLPLPPSSPPRARPCSPVSPSCVSLRPPSFHVLIPHHRPKPLLQSPAVSYAHLYR